MNLPLPAAAALALMPVCFTQATPVTGTITDSDTGSPIAARVYIQSDASKTFYHVTSTVAEGSAEPYSRKSGIASIEMHTAVSAHPYTADLPKGDYTLTVERGKEYFTETRRFSVPESKELNVKLKRWINMAERGWFSGDTHVHRTVAELPTVQLAEDLNVAFPLTAWVTDSRDAPNVENKNPEPVPAAQLNKIDSTHVFWPVNTEYEIFTIDGKNHTLGAVFILNHKSAFPQTAPPVAPIAEEARKQGGILELDKHSWPWSMMIVKKMGVQLYELSNNHVWRTRFGFRSWYPEYVGKDMGIEMEDGAFTERGWIHFGFENYYALLNCGLDLKPTAGTASGVHPVPLGFGRVYVNVDGGFTYDKWLHGLTTGRSFVTTGPMLFTSMKKVGNQIKIDVAAETPAIEEFANIEIEIIGNGEIEHRAVSRGELTASGARRAEFRVELALEDSSAWFAVRVFIRQHGRLRFAHSAPVYFEVPDKPLRPRKRDTDYLIKRVEDELKRHQDVLPDSALKEYRDVLTHYQKLAETSE
ncbi:MAG: hypothetical protein ACI9R3_002908 [Verrucomicrobiales bacterium]|jgi:hypothetical protein